MVTFHKLTDLILTTILATDSVVVDFIKAVVSRIKEAAFQIKAVVSKIKEAAFQIKAVVSQTLEAGFPMEAAVVDLLADHLVEDLVAQDHLEDLADQDHPAEDLASQRAATAGGSHLQHGRPTTASHSENISGSLMDGRESRACRIKNAEWQLLCRLAAKREK
jgi:hypothetical protein